MVGMKKPKIIRVPLELAGPGESEHTDRHEKIGADALKMGSVGLPYYGAKDKYTAFSRKMTVLPDVRDDITIAHWYLDLVEENGRKHSVSGDPNGSITDKF